jgi:hypothetical protein
MQCLISVSVHCGAASDRRGVALLLLWQPLLVLLLPQPSSLPVPLPLSLLVSMSLLLLTSGATATPISPTATATATTVCWAATVTAAGAAIRYSSLPLLFILPRTTAATDCCHCCYCHCHCCCCCCCSVGYPGGTKSLLTLVWSWVDSTWPAQKMG